MVGKSKTHHVPNPVSLGNRGEGADAQLEGEEAEEEVAREVAQRGLRPTKRGAVAGAFVVASRGLPRSGLHALSLAPLDPRDTCRGSEDARAPVVPPNAEARRILGQNLLDDARPARLSSTLRLDDDPVFYACVHRSASCDWISSTEG